MKDRDVKKIQDYEIQAVRPSFLTVFTLLLLLPGGAFAQIVATGNDPVVNTGPITTSASGAHGILSTGTGAITNAASGTITTTGSGAYGISSTGTGDITNEGEISSSTPSGQGIHSEGNNNTQIRIRNTGMISSMGTGILSSGNAEITNAAGGTITTTGGVGTNVIFASGMANIMNEGEINSSGAGIRSTGDNSQISNTGAITSRGAGIFSDGIGTRINNSGTIDSMNEGGIFTAGNNTTITNSTGGVITIRGGFSNGISSAGTGVNVINEGTIDVDGGQSYGIITQGVGTMVEIRNTGLITTIGDDSSAIFSVGNDTITNAAGGRLETDGDIAYGIVTTGDGDITNAGMITTTGISSYGIFASGGEGAIRNTGEISTRAAHGIYTTGGRSVTNAGTITGFATNAHGISSFGGTGDITNDGEIIAGGGIGINSTGDIDRISNRGEIFSGGEGINSTGDTGMISNSGMISSGGDGIRSEGDETVIINAAGGMIQATGASAHGIFSSSTGDITNEGGISSSEDGIRSIGDNSMITNSGTILSLGDGIHSEGDETVIINDTDGVITVRKLGADTSTSSGIFSTGTGAITNNGMIETSGDFIAGIFSERSSQIRNTGTIMTDGDQADGIFSSGDGVVITVGEDGIITTTGENAHGIVAMGNSEITVNGTVSATGEGSYAIRGSDSEDQTLILGAGALIEGALDLGEREGDNDVLDIEANPQRSQTFAISGVDTVRSGAVPVLQSGNTVAVLDSTGSSATRIALGAMTGQIRRQVFQRLDSRRLSRGAAAKRDAWGGLFGMVSDRDEDEMALAWDHSLYGVSGGVDMLLESGQRVGVFAGVGRNRVRTKVTSIRDTATHGFVGAYGQQSIGEFNLDGAVLFGYGRHDSDRAVTGDEVANGKYDNFYVSPSLSLKWFKGLGEGLEFRPRAEISYTYGDFSGYTERETTNSNISFNGRSVHIADGRLELALARTFDDDQGEIEVRGGATLTHFGEDSVRARLGGGSSVSHRITGENTIRGGFGGIRMRYQITDLITMNGDLEYASSGDGESTGGYMWLGLQF